MTVFAKNTYYGLELPIFRLQELIDDELTWAGTNNIYGIIFKNAKDNSIVPEAWTGKGVKGTEYKEVFNDDRSTSQIGFLPISRNVISRSAIVRIIITVDLIKAYGANIRDNERAYLEMQRIIERTTTIIEDSFRKGIPDVFSEFRTDNIKYLDMQPYDCFSFDVQLSYPNNIPCTSL